MTCVKGRGQDLRNDITMLVNQIMTPEAFVAKWGMSLLDVVSNNFLVDGVELLEMSQDSFEVRYFTHRLALFCSSLN